MSLFDLLTEEQQAERYSCCIRKVRHYSEEEAHQAMRRIQGRGENKPLHVYPCQYCGGYHVGGCLEEEENDIRIIDGFPYRKVSVQHGPEDAKRYKQYLQRKGYRVEIRKQKRKTRTNYHMYAYHPIRDAQPVQGVTA